MRLKAWQIQLTALLVLLTFVFYALRWSLFPEPPLHEEMLRFLVGDVAFPFLQVLLVTVFIDGVTRQREKDEMRQKLDMVIGAFFSQAGTELLGLITTSDSALAEVRNDLVARPNWTLEDFRAAKEAFKAHNPRIDLTRCWERSGSSTLPTSSPSTPTCTRSRCEPIRSTRRPVQRSPTKQVRATRRVLQPREYVIPRPSSMALSSSTSDATPTLRNWRSVT